MSKRKEDNGMITGSKAVSLNSDRHSATVTPTQGPIPLTLVIPTRNEVEGVEALLERLEASLHEPTEVLFVDDSDDATPQRVRELAEQRTWDGLAVSLVHRTGRRRHGGLGSAVVEGIRRARGTWVGVLDADLQHPPELLDRLHERALAGDVDVVVASRYQDGGSSEGLSGTRQTVSRACATAARMLFPRRLRGVSDPLSGFFLVRRAAVDPDELRPHGFKILLEILGRNPQLRAGEVGYTFSERYAGVSKASIREALRYVHQLLSLRLASRGQSRTVCHYDIHGILSVSSDAPLPELERFRCRYVEDPPTLRVRVKRFDRRSPGELLDFTELNPRLHYDEAFGQEGFVLEFELGETTAEAVVSPLLAHSTHVLYTNVVEPILRWKFVERGYALVHAACFVEDGDAHMVTARTDTGKTTTMLKVLEKGDYGFLSDDLTLISGDGQVLTYPKPLTISNHTVHALTSSELTRMQRFFLPLQSRLHSRSGRRFAFLLADKRVPVATLNAWAQRIIPPPKYHADQLVPGVRLDRVATPASLFIIERGKDERERLPIEVALDILLENCEDAYGFPPYEPLEAFMHSAHENDLRLLEREIITRGLMACPAWRMSSSSMGWAEQIHGQLTDLDVQSDDSVEAVVANTA
jgi:hypothetical protein